MTVSFLPDLPLVCLQTAQSSSTIDAFSGRNTVIDFWTTQCTRCPDALDKLNGYAQDPKYENVQFVSICCDQLDGAREIFEQQEDVRWSHVQHYFMEAQHKEQAKHILGFKTVPYYVMLNLDGEITQKGSKVDFDDMPGVVQPTEGNTNKNGNAVLAASVKERKQEPNGRVFEIDEFDF